MKRHIVAALILLTVTIAMILSGCGKEKCVDRFYAGEELTVGTYEKIECPEGQFVHSVNPKHLPGVPTPTHLIVTCVKLERVCE